MPTGIYVRTPECRAKSSAAMKKRWESPEFMARMSAAKKGNKNLLGYRFTAESRAKMSATQKRRFANPANHPNWKGGISKERYGWEWNAELREEVRRRDGHRCRVCGVSQVECKRKLDVHHVDYNKRNRDPVNLISLCHNCHRRTNRNRKHWTTVFQAMAIKRSIAELESQEPVQDEESENA